MITEILSISIFGDFLCDARSAVFLQIFKVCGFDTVSMILTKFSSMLDIQFLTKNKGTISQTAIRNSCCYNLIKHSIYEKTRVVITLYLGISMSYCLPFRVHLIDFINKMCEVSRTEYTKCCNWLTPSDIFTEKLIAQLCIWYIRYFISWPSIHFRTIQNIKKANFHKQFLFSQIILHNIRFASRCA